MNDNYQAWINAPFGCVAIALKDEQLHVELLAITLSGGNKESSLPLVMTAYSQITLYLQDPKSKSNYSNMLQGTEFQRKVWLIIDAIPAGETRTYGEIAVAINSGPRAVANACGANKLPLLIPCHRVVAQNGLGGFMQGNANGGLIKQWLLEHEGVFNYA